MNLTDTQQLQLDYWTGLSQHLREHHSTVRPRKPRPSHWMGFAIGRSDFGLAASIHLADRWIRVGLMISGPDAKAYFHLLERDRAAIEREIGAAPSWQYLSHREGSRIRLHHPTADPNNLGDWPRQFAWLQQNLDAFHHAFARRVARLNAGDYRPGSDS